MTDELVGRNGEQRSSIRDVARLAGVSTATVSRVLTGARPVREESAAAVLAAVERLSYRPNQLGRALRRQSTQVVGMILPKVDNPFFPAVLQSSEQYLRNKGYALLLCTSDDDPAVEGQRVEMLVDRRVDGLLVSPCHRVRSATAIEDAARTVPVVELDRGTDGYTGDFVSVDDAAGIQQLVSHLRQTGRRALAFVGGEVTSYSGACRASAFERLEPAARSRKRILVGHFSEDWGYRAGHTLLSSADRPDAIVCGNDLIAIGVTFAAEELGVRIPEDVAVTGYDDIELARMCRPPLTTVRQPVIELTHRAIDLLIARLHDPDRPPRRVLLPTELVVRASTQPSD
jgi:LacI family transcriptional regulator